MALNTNLFESVYARPIDVSDPDLLKFRNQFRVEYYEGKKHRTIAPYDNIWRSDTSIMDLESRTEPGVAIEMAASDFHRLREAAMETIEVRRLRAKNPALQQAWEEYQMILALTTIYDQKDVI
jgi:hypothetical protein